MTEIREVLRAWLAGAGLRRVAEQAGVDRKTARRYVEAAVDAGLVRGGGICQLTDELVGQVAQAVRPARPGGHGLAWEQLNVGLEYRGTGPRHWPRHADLIALSAPCLAG